MFVFYAVVILIGVLCVVFSGFLYLLDKKKSLEITENIDKKTLKLEEAILDAEQIVMEMNNFSEYILGKIDEKVKELEKKDSLYAMVNNSTIHSSENKKEVELIETNNIPQNLGQNIDLTPIHAEIDFRELYGLNKEEVMQNPKHQEILNLRKNGLKDIEIAKELEMGIGEVRLILGMKI